MLAEKVSYHKAADQFLKLYYENNAGKCIVFSYRLISRLAGEAKVIAKSVSLTGMDYQDAIVATRFRYAGSTDLTQGVTESMTRLLHAFFDEINYPADHRHVVEESIMLASENKVAETKVQQVTADAVNSKLARPDILENIILLKEEVNRLTAGDKGELFYAAWFMKSFINFRYYTAYANESYSLQRERNFQLLDKRMRKLEEAEKIAKKNNGKPEVNLSLSNKETEDLFKIAFRNYNHLVSVADSKASLLIQVNSIIITIMLGFVLSKVEKNIFLLWPAILLLTVSMTTIFLSILASRPQNNIISEDRNSGNFQKFFFGSFDLIDRRFRKVGWETYYNQLNELFGGNKENVYLEAYKESYNVRRVLSKKFYYLSIAYRVFITGLLLSIIAFVFSISSQPQLAA